MGFAYVVLSVIRGVLCNSAHLVAFRLYLLLNRFQRGQFLTDLRGRGPTAISEGNILAEPLTGRCGKGPSLIWIRFGQCELVVQPREIEVGRIESRFELIRSQQAVQRRLRFAG